MTTLSATPVLADVHLLPLNLFFFVLLSTTLCNSHICFTALFPFH